MFEPKNWLPPEPNPDIAKFVVIAGDVHTKVGVLNQLISDQFLNNKTLKDYAAKHPVEGWILQCGDFGYFWPGNNMKGFIKNQADFLVDGHVKIIWCPGNHEDYSKLDPLFQQNMFTELEPGIILARFGAHMKLTDETTIMFCGKANSHDREYRIKDVSWWESENITNKDMKLLDYSIKPDWIISHTAPNFFEIPDINNELEAEPSRKKLDKVLNYFKPKHWYFGHFHKKSNGIYSFDKKNKCHWHGLSVLGWQDAPYMRVDPTTGNLWQNNKFNSF